MTAEEMTVEQARAAGLLPAGDLKLPKKKANETERTKHQRHFRAAFKCIGKGLPPPVEELRFHETRKWRFDFAWESFWCRKTKNFLDIKVAVELQGGTFSKGRHARGSGIEKDLEKQREAQKLGWIVLCYGTLAMRDPYKVAAEVAEVLRERMKAS